MDAINHPAHYTVGKIEVIDAIEDWRLGFHAGNVVKYVARHKHKNGLEDLKKAAWYLARLIEITDGSIDVKEVDMERMEGFEFKPGDMVALRVNLNWPQPDKFMVIECHVQQCPGGIQRKYSLRGFRYGDNNKFAQIEMMLLDIEVAAYPSDAELAQRLETAIKKEMDWAAARRAHRMGSPTMEA